MENNPLADALDRVRRVAAAQHGAHLSDSALLERFVSVHDGSAFTALVERHGALVYGVCARILRAPQDSEDACQATFLVLARKASLIRKGSSLASWLHGVARRVSLTLRRERHQRRLREQQSPVPEPATAAADLMWSEVRVLLDEELERLPVRFRSSLILCYLEGKTRDEAAAALGVTPGRLHGLLQRGRDLLRERLVKRGVGLGGGLLGAGLSGGACQALPPPLAVRIVNGAVAALGGEALAPPVVSARVLSLTNEVSRAMFHTKLKAAAQWAVCVGILCALAGGAVLAAGLTQPNDRPPAGGEQVLALAPVPKAPPAEPRVGLRQTTLRAPNLESVTFSPDGKTIASGHWSVTLWDAASGQELTSFSGHAAGCSGHVAFHPERKVLAVTCLGSPVPSEDLYTIYVWDLSTGKAFQPEGKPELRLKGHKTYVRVVAYSPDGKVLASGSGDGVAKLWDATTGKELSTLTGGLHGLAFRPDGKVLATGCGDDAIKLWDVATGKELATFAGVTTSQSPLAFSPDGKSIASTRKDNVVVLWDVPNEKHAKVRARVTLKGHRDEILAVAFSPDGKLLATGSADKTVRLWDVATGKERAVLKRHGRAVHCVTFSPDGNTLVSGGRDETLQLWDVSRELTLSSSAGGSRRIDVPPTGDRYKPLKSQVINSRKEFDALVAQVRGAGLREEEQAALIKTLADARVDFTRESLVLIRQDEIWPDAAHVTFAPVVCGDTLVCAIHREIPAAGAKAGRKRPDEGCYCFALAVDKDKIKKVETSVSTTED